MLDTLVPLTRRSLPKPQDTPQCPFQLLHPSWVSPVLIACLCCLYTFYKWRKLDFSQHRLLLQFVYLIWMEWFNKFVSDFFCSPSCLWVSAILRCNCNLFVLISVYYSMLCTLFLQLTFVLFCFLQCILDRILYLPAESVLVASLR